MAISFVNSAQAAAATVAMPAHQEGDVIVIFAYRNTTTAPSLPAGYTNLQTVSANSNALRVGYKIAVSSSETTGTWTNANVIRVVIYRGAGGVGASAIGSNAASTTTTIPALTMQNTGGSAWVTCFAGSRQTVSQSTPTGTTIRGTFQAGTTSGTTTADTNGGVASWASHTSTAGGSATGAGAAVEILPAYAAASTLTDNYDDNSLDTGLWLATNDAGVTVAETNQEIEISMAAVAGYGTLQSQSFYALLNSSFYTQMVDAGNQALQMDVIPIYATDSPGANKLFITIDGGSIFCEYIINSAAAVSVGTAVAYDSTIRKWFKIGHSSGTITFYYSTDGTTWTTLQTLAASTFTYGLLALSIGVQAGIWGTAGTTTLKFDNFNNTPVVGPTTVKSLGLLGVG